jgi:hypothetical protein
MPIPGAENLGSAVRNVHQTLGQELKEDEWTKNGVGALVKLSKADVPGGGGMGLDEADLCEEERHLMKPQQLSGGVKTAIVHQIFGHYRQKEVRSLPCMSFMSFSF